MRTPLIVVALVSCPLLALAQDVTCDEAAKSVEWHMCVSAPVEYQKGLKKEVRDECVVDKVIPAKNGCMLGDVRALIPADVKGHVFFYALGPLDLEFLKDFDKQSLPGKAPGCQLNGQKFTDTYKFMKFGDAMDKDNAARSKMVNEKLKEKGKKVVIAVNIVAPQPEKCVGGTATLGFVDKKTSSKFIAHMQAKW